MWVLKMTSIYLKEDDMSDIDLLDEYNEEYMNIYPEFKPFATKENYADIIKCADESKQGINNNGIKEIFYWAIEDRKIVGHGSIRLNPEIDEESYKYCGHIMYGVVPSKRKQGYGTKICHLLLEKLNEYGIEIARIGCFIDNIGSSFVIENNYGKLIEIVEPNENYTKPSKMYEINVKESLKLFNKSYNESKKIIR